MKLLNWPHVSILCNICCIIIEIHGYCSFFESAAFDAFCFLKVFGFYTLVQEPHCVHEHFLNYYFQVAVADVSHTILPVFLPLLLANLSSRAYV